MEIEAFLADSVATAEGKLYVQGGGWNLVNVAQFPYRLARCGIALIVRIPYTATNQGHKFELFLRNEDGQELPLGDAPPGTEAPDGKIRRLGGEFTVGRPPMIQPGDEQLVALAINIDGLVFETPSRYEFVVDLDGTEVKHLGFRILQVPQMAIIR
jgi:hypothetical protein